MMGDGMMVQCEIQSGVRNLTVGVVSAAGVRIGPTTEHLIEACRSVAQLVRDSGMVGGESRRDAVRQMIRAGGFKPAGRNKPAQEYLLRTVMETGQLPPILNVVDWINAVSLSYGLPISLLSARNVGQRALIRYGEANEKFVFNPSGQEIAVEGLICVCSQSNAESVPLGTPIKDSMAGKVTENDTDILAFVYAPREHVAPLELTHCCEELARGFRDYCGATSVDLSQVL